MPYLFHHNHCFSIVDRASRYGVFCQSYNQLGATRPVSIQTGSNSAYSATMDSEGKLHILCMPDPAHINYFCYENNRCLQKKLVANATENYILSDPHIYFLHNTLHITYLSNQVGSLLYSLVEQNLDGTTFHTLLDSHYKPYHIKSFVQNEILYLFYVLQDDSYHLRCIKVQGTQIELLTYLDSPIPIIDYSICIERNHVHITYLLEMHGKYQLFYCNNEMYTPLSLCITATPSYPVIFSYLSCLWINATIEHQLQVLLSVNGGRTFSLPTTTSLQNSMHRYSFKSYMDNSLNAQEVYASANNALRLNTVYMIDVDQIHSDTKVAVELELLIEGLRLASLYPSNVTLSIEKPTLKTETKNDITAPLSPPHEDLPPMKSISSAKNAFMEELNSWDLPPLL